MRVSSIKKVGQVRASGVERRSMQSKWYEKTGHLRARDP